METKPTSGSNCKMTKVFICKQQSREGQQSQGHLKQPQMHPSIPGFGQIFAMLHDLSTIVKTPEQPMQTWITSVQDFALHLKGAGFNIPKITVIVTLLQGLPYEYFPLIMTVGTTPLEDLTLTSIIMVMLNEESLKSNHRPPPHDM
ncbi:hypothetical protein PAXINDRAFT_16278 [Paxillus involutus ATCC 200175]|uniref:Uncharacterized protein n=1 Tax=Paxillus involutus ATCC 200175 TaxID=664439 RepID=A0A0C9TU43_PAXIN|nr:hypothetical protein PAXINDRAFT_16278 [Paxillus involutus ATCC 200175]